MLRFNIQITHESSLCKSMLKSIFVMRGLTLFVYNKPAAHIEMLYYFPGVMPDFIPVLPTAERKSVVIPATSDQKRRSSKL